jgi:hypothetical protein
MERNMKNVLRMTVLSSMVLMTVAAFAAAPKPVNISIVPAPSPMVSGQDNSINVTVTDASLTATAGTLVTVGRVHVKLATFTDAYSNVSFSPCTGSNGYSQDVNVGNDLNSVAPSAQGDALIPLGYSSATIGIRVEYDPADGSGYHQTTVACSDFPVNNAPVCTAGLNIYEAGVSGPDVLTTNAFSKTSSGTGTWQLLITVENCNPFGVTNVKAQGGTSAWTTPSVAVTGDANPTMGGLAILKNTSKNKSGGSNYVITWNIPSMQAFEKAYVLVNLTGTIQCGQTNPLNGAWSVLSTETPKSDYTGVTNVIANCQ